MKPYKYIILIILLISLSVSSFSHIIQGFTMRQSKSMNVASMQSGSFGFFETFTFEEVTSRLEPADRFFQLIETKGVSKESSKLGSCSELSAPDVWVYIHSESFLKLLPGDIRFAWGASHENTSVALFALREPSGNNHGPDHSDIQGVEIRNSDHNSEYELFISFSDKGAQKWATLTGNNVGRNIAILFNDLVYTAPMVREKIKDGKCAISGNFSEDDLVELKSILKN